MGNRTFLYLTDRFPDAEDEDAPEFCASVAEGNNCLPPLWLVLLSAPVQHAPQDFQQVFLPSVYGGAYGERALGERRLFALLDFIAGHPRLADPATFRYQVEGLRGFLASLPGEAYSADLNEWFMLSDGDCPADELLDRAMEEWRAQWTRAEAAMAHRDYAAIEEIYNLAPENAADSLGFQCWSHDFFGGRDWREKRDLSFEQFVELEGCDLGRGLCAFEEGGKYGVRRDDGQVILPARYDDICAFDYDDEVEVAALVVDERWGLFDARGKVALEPSLDELAEYREGMAVARLGDAFGYLDGEGRWLVAPRYDDAFDFSHGMARVVSGGLTGYINPRGVEVVPPSLVGEGDDFDYQGLVCARTAVGCGLIDRSGAMVVPAGFQDIAFNHDIQAWIARRRDGETAVFFGDGRPWFAGRFDDFHRGAVARRGDGHEIEAVVECAGKMGTVRADGSAGVPPIYAAVTPLELSQRGQERIPGALYLVASKRGGATGVCAADGTLLVPPEFSAIEELPCSPDNQAVEEEDDEQGEEADDDNPAPPMLLSVATRQGAGIWSLDAQRLVLPCACVDVRAFECGRAQYLFARETRGGFVIADAAGKPVGARTYDWLFHEDNAKASTGYHYLLIVGFIQRAWAAGEPVSCRRNGRDWHLFADGREVPDPDGE